MFHNRKHPKLSKLLKTLREVKGKFNYGNLEAMMGRTGMVSCLKLLKLVIVPNSSLHPVLPHNSRCTKQTVIFSKGKSDYIWLKTLYWLLITLRINSKSLSCLISYNSPFQSSVTSYFCSWPLYLLVPLQEHFPYPCMAGLLHHSNLKSNVIASERISLVANHPNQLPVTVILPRLIILIVFITVWNSY